MSKANSITAVRERYNELRDEHGLFRTVVVMFVVFCVILVYPEVIEWVTEALDD